MSIKLPQLRDSILATLVAVGLVVFFSPLIKTAFAQTGGAGAQAAAALGLSNIPEVKVIQEAQRSTAGPTLAKQSDLFLSNTAGSFFLAISGGRMVDNGTGQLTESPGAIQTLGTMMASLYQKPPATSEQYVAYVLESANVIPPAYAQGIGFSALSPVLTAWRTFRNIAYFCFVIIFLFIGFMIMFRRKVGQTAVTAQQAIPSVIVALLAVTFSYAIAGLLIDIMYLVMYLILGLFGASPATYLNIGPLEFGYNLIRGSFSSSYIAVGEAVESLFGSLGVLAEGGAFLGSIAVAIVVSLAVLIGMFRLFFELLKTYISIIIGVALAPLYLMLGAIPGKSMFGKWVRNLIGNLAAFPTVLVILLIYDQLTGGFSGKAASVSQAGFKPPYLFGFGSTEIIPFMVGLGMLLITTELVVKAKKNFGATGGLFEEFGGNVGQALKRGWSGDYDVIPGIGATNLAKSPLTKWMGGISGQNLVGRPGKLAGQTGLVAGGGVTGALTGGVSGLLLGGPYGGRVKNIIARGTSGALASSRRAADITDFKHGLTKDRKSRQEGKTPYNKIK